MTNRSAILIVPESRPISDPSYGELVFSKTFVKGLVNSLIGRDTLEEVILVRNHMLPRGLYVCIECRMDTFAIYACSVEVSTIEGVLS